MLSYVNLPSNRQNDFHKLKIFFKFCKWNLFEKSSLSYLKSKALLRSTQYTYSYPEESWLTKFQTYFIMNESFEERQTLFIYSRVQSHVLPSIALRRLRHKVSYSTLILLYQNLRRTRMIPFSEINVRRFTCNVKL